MPKKKMKLHNIPVERKKIFFLSARFFFLARIFSCSHKKNLLQEKKSFVTINEKKFLTSEIIFVGERSFT